MFELDIAIAEWRRQMAAGGIKSSEALDELESHLRDDIDQQVQSGLSEARAFALASQRIGQAVALKREFSRAGASSWAILRKLKRILFGSDLSQLPRLEHFAPSARQSLEWAPDEARHFHHDFVGTEHVLLGLIQSPTDLFADWMHRLGVDGRKLRASVEEFVGSGPIHEIAATIPFTPRAGRALQLALSEAEALNHPLVEPEHIFLGLLLEGGGVAAHVLRKRGVSYKVARKELLKVIGSESE